MNRQPKQKIKLQDEIKSIKKDRISATFEISSNQIEIPLHNLVKYSRIVQEEIMKNDICSELNKSIQKVSIRYKNSINTFLNLLNDEETEIKNEELTDLLKLSEIFKVEQLKNVLKKYLQDHSKNVDFILSLKIEKENSKEEISILNDDVSEEMEECLKANINECLENDKIKEISVSSIYRMIEKSSREHISNDLLCRFIIESIKERHFLFKFVEVEKLSEEIFEELIKIYTKFNLPEHNQTHYFDFLPNNLSYINELILKQKSLEKRIEDLEKKRDNMTRKNQKKIEKMLRMNEEQEIQHREEIKLKEEKIDKISKEHIKIKEEIDQLKQIIKKKEEKEQQLNETIIQLKTENSSQRKRIDDFTTINNKPQVTCKIIEYLTKEFNGNIHDKGVVNVTASTSIFNNSPKNAVDIYNNKNYFASDDLPNSWLKYDFNKRKVNPNSYSITTVHDLDEDHPRNWVIEGSNNDLNWVILDTRQNDKSLSGLSVTCIFIIEPQKESYRYLRIRQTGKNSVNRDNLFLSSLEFIGTLSNDK